MRTLVLTLLIVTPVVLGFPQSSGVSGDDILSSADNAERYGTDSDSIDPDLIDEIFGGSNSNQKSNQGSDGSYSGDLNEEPRPNNINNNNQYTPPKTVKADAKSVLCSDYQEDGYQCVPYYQCDELGEIITDGGPGLIDIRGNFGQEIELDPENSKCEGYLEVCCRHPDYTAPIKPKPKPYVSKCGTRNINGIGVRIQNDDYAASTQFGEWPHMCAVLEKSGDKNLYVCGGSLIAPGVVMTAAHCVDKYTNAGANGLKVRCGEWDTQKTSEPVEHQDRDVEYISAHPGFSPKNLTNNVALLHVYEDFIMSAHIDVICLPNLQELQQSYDWDKCFATGWGKDRFDESGQYQVILKQVELNVVSPYECQEALRATRLGKNFNLDPTALCAGGQSDVDTCKGDGGGPLVCPTGEDNGYGPQYVQAGIVGWGIGCGNDGVPGVYTDVADMLCYIDWATRCVTGEPDTDYYGIQGCKHWAQRERRRIKQALDSYEYQASLATGRNKVRLLARAESHKATLQRYVQAIRNCKSADFQDEENYGDDEDLGVDLSGYVRTSASIEKKEQILKGEVVEEEYN